MPPKTIPDLEKTLELDKFTIGFAGRMLEEKGIEDIINAGKLLKFPYQLLFIGDGKDKAKFKKLTDKAVWIDPQPPGKMNKYYNCMDVLVLPSRTTKKWKEQFGRVIIEAMLCGVPVIGSSSGEIPRVIGDAGLIFKEQDSQELAERITSLYESAPLRNELAERGLSYAKQFDWKYVADKVHKIYMSLLYE